MPSSDDAVIEIFSSIVGSSNVVKDRVALEESLSNSSGASAKVLAIVSPGTREELIDLVKVAHNYKVGLYPISCGMNLGYGELVPTSDDNIILKLDRLDKISEYDETLGQVFLEPGVSQCKLHQYLNDNNSNYFADVTGAARASSVLGNTIDGGIGHSPLGYRRHNICEIEVVLADGEVIRTQEFPSLGPDISGLFVQSNYGVVIGIKISLCRIPDDFEMFLVSIDSETELEELVNSTRVLLQKGTLNSLVHIGNSVRALVSTRTCPDEWKDKTVTSVDAQKILRNALVKPGVWNAVGGLYGSPHEIKAKKRALKKCYPAHFKIAFFSEKKLSKLTRISESKVFKYLDKNQNAELGIASLKSVFSLMRGNPSDTAFDNASWKANSKEQLGLIWLAPTARSNGRSVSEMVNICNDVFMEMGFDMPITLTFAKPTKIVSAIGIHFDKSDPNQQESAIKLYRAASDKIYANGYAMYRLPSNQMEIMNLQNSSTSFVLNAIKKALDPNSIISSDRYRIGN